MSDSGRTPAMSRLLPALTLVVAALGACASNPPSDPEAAACQGMSGYTGEPFLPASPEDIARGLGRGVNLGNMFDAPFEGAWNIHYMASYIELVKEAGFAHIRLPVRWSNHVAVTEDAALDESFACRIDGVIDHALSAGLYVVMDMHHHRQLDGDTLDPSEAPVDDSIVDQRFVNIWSHLGARYQARSNRLVFEIYNEPHRRLNAEAWNDLAARALAAIRASNPQRAVMLGAINYYSVGSLDSLQLPDDPNLIVTIHNYDPFQFTFQGSPTPGSDAWIGTPCCNAGQQQQISDALDVGAAYGAEQGYPVYLGEFGSSTAADATSRAAYARYVRDQAEARQMPWAVWSLIDYGVYDPVAGAWREDLKTALLGP